MRSAPLRVLGVHPRDKQPVELHAGRYGPYVRHGATNATLPDRDAVDSLSLEQAIALVDEKAGRTTTATTRKGAKSRAPRTTREAEAQATELPASTRRVVGTRGARTVEPVAHTPAISRTSTRTARATKRSTAAKSAAASRGESASAAKAKSSAGRTSVVKKRAATKRAPPEGKIASGRGVTRTRSASSTATRKAPVARKTTTAATARKGKRR
jgi:hypothetical protein